MNKLLEDQLEPVAREIAHFLQRANAFCGSSWRGYTRDEPLIPFERKRNDLIEFVRIKNKEARINLYNIKEGAADPDSLIIEPPIVLEEKTRATTTVEVNNLESSRPSEPFRWTKEFSTGESELDAFETSIQHETTTTASAEAGIEGVADAKVETTVRESFSAAYSRQTGITRSTTTGGEFALVADPHTFVRGLLRWSEQTLQRRIRMKADYTFGVEIGRRSKRKGRWDWNSKSPQRWESLEHLLAVAERRGSVKHDLYKHFAETTLSRWALAALSNIKELRHQQIDRLTPPFQGADAFRVILTQVEKRSEEEGNP